MRGRLIVFGVLMAVAATACGTSARSSAPRQVAERFYAALARHDGGTACALLAPRSRHQVEQTSQRPCAAGILDTQLPRARTVVSTEVWGDAARVRLDSDTVFLADYGGWLVVAAGCRPRHALPYDCQIEEA